MLGATAADRDHRSIAEAVDRAWLEAGSDLDAAQRRVVLAALLHQLDHGGVGDGWVDALHQFDPGLAVAISDGIALRQALHDVVVRDRPPEEAIVAQHRLGLLVDELVADATTRRLRELLETSHVDPLTGLHNRRAAAKEVSAVLAHARRYDRPAAIAIADLVGLKAINDTWGHAAGDDALRRFAKALRDNLRTGEAAFRFGGDEFVVVASDATAEELRHLFDRVAPDAPAFSYGIAEAPMDGEDGDALLAVADARMYDTRSAASMPPDHGRALSRLEVGLLAFALATVGVLVADVVRKLVGIELDSGGLAVWRSLLVATPMLAAGGSVWAGATDFKEALWRSSGLAAVAMLVLVAALTPMLPDRSPSDADTGREREVPSSSTTTTSTPTTASTAAMTSTPDRALAGTAMLPGLVQP